MGSGASTGIAAAAAAASPEELAAVLGGLGSDAQQKLKSALRGDGSSATTLVLKPEGEVPSEPVPLTRADSGILGAPDQTMCNLFRGTPDLPALQAAFGRVVSKNPTLASRLVRQAEDKVCFSFDGPIGCPFCTSSMDARLEEAARTTLTARTAATESVAVQTLLYKQLQVPKVGKSKDLVDKDLPLCKVSVFWGSELTILTFSFSHAIGDLFTYHNLLRAWDEEFSSAGASIAMQPRVYLQNLHRPMEAMGGVSRLKRSGNTLTLTVCMSLDEEKQMKAEVAKELLEGSKFSGNDVILAHVSNALDATALIYAVENVRGTTSDVHGSVPRRCEGNTFDTRLAFLREAGSKFSALTVRESLAVADPRGAVLVDPMKLHMTTSWDKLQYWPRFGMELLSSSLQGIEWFTFGILYTTKYLVTPEEYVIVTSGLTSEEASALEQEWKRAGISCMGLASHDSFDKCKQD